MKSQPWVRASLTLLCIHLRDLSLQPDPQAHLKDDSLCKSLNGTPLLEFLKLQLISCIVFWKKQQPLQRLLMLLGGGFCRKAFVVMPWLVKYMPHSNNAVNLLFLNFLPSLSPVLAPFLLCWIPLLWFCL